MAFDEIFNTQNKTLRKLMSPRSHKVSRPSHQRHFLLNGQSDDNIYEGDNVINGNEFHKIFTVNIKYGCMSTAGTDDDEN